jgi:uncharacterized protein YwgA
MGSNPTPRSKDVLFALAAAEEISQPLGRLPLQKMIYLADVLAPVWREASVPPGFSPYRNGPYDRRIQNTVDALVFRGIATVVAPPTFRRPDNVECKYSLTEAGRDAVKKIAEEKDFDDELGLFRAITAEISRRGWHHIKALVYAEPTYDRARATGNWSRLLTDSPSENLTREFLRGFRDAMRSPTDRPMSRANLIKMFFAVLERQAELEPRKLEKRQ